MKCPKCDGYMEQLTYNDITVDRCANCFGIWFDVGEKEALKDMKGSETIDIKDKERAEAFNKITNIDCPRCSIRMAKMVDNDQPHIWYESCVNCGGSFFDAGEFTDYKTEELGDIIRDIKVRFKGGRE